MTNGGKFIFGKSLMREALMIPLPTQAVVEYNIVSESKVLSPHRKQGFCITRKGLPVPSKLVHIQLTPRMINFLNLKIRMELLSIRSSDIVFILGAKGPLLEKSEPFDSQLKVY